MAKQADKDAQKTVHIQNRRARYEYTFLTTYVAGLMLQGTEIKSIREGNVQIQDGYCSFQLDGSLWIYGMQIGRYTAGTYNNHEPLRVRKLLLQKRELRQLRNKSDEAGLTIVPTRLFINERGFAKLEIALARGKKLFDKREDLKAKDAKREIDRF
jgi:SsrA-binding protein